MKKKMLSSVMRRTSIWSVTKAKAVPGRASFVNFWWPNFCRMKGTVAAAAVACSSPEPVHATPSSAGYSYRHGTSSVPLLGITLSRVLDEAADKYGSDRLAAVVVKQAVRKNFLQLRHDVDKLATGLLSLGLKKGDRVGIWGPNSYEWLLAQFATARAGLILVCINPAYQKRELEYCLNKVGVAAVIAADSFKTQDYYEILTKVAPEIGTSKSVQINCQSLPDLKFLIMISDKNRPGTIRFDDIMTAGGSEQQNLLSDLIHDIQPDDPVNIQFTSGTTGNPKGATLSHHNIINNAYFVGKRLQYDLEPHRLCISVPLYHCFGNILGAFNVLVHGICAVCPSPSFEAEASLRAIHQEKCTSVYGTPTMFVDMLNHPRFTDYEYTSLKTGIMSGAPCPEELVRQTSTKMNAKNLIVVYGSTETSPVSFACNVGDSIETRSTKVGHPLDHLEVKIVDESGKTLPIGKMGELWTRGFSTMLGYWNDDVKTKEAVTPAGWYRTGDLFVMHEDGYGQIVGRIKDTVIRGGENIYPREIEDFLHTHPEIADAQVVGVPDKRLGEELCVWIKLIDGHTLTEEDVRQYCKGKISHFKIPRYIRFVSSYPMTVTGKIQKFIMRTEMINMLNLQ